MCKTSLYGTSIHSENGQSEQCVTETGLQVCLNLKTKQVDPELRYTIVCCKHLRNLYYFFSRDNYSHKNLVSHTGWP